MPGGDAGPELTTLPLSSGATMPAARGSEPSSLQCPSAVSTTPGPTTLAFAQVRSPSSVYCSTSTHCQWAQNGSPRGPAASISSCHPVP